MHTHIHTHTREKRRRIRTKKNKAEQRREEKRREEKRREEKRRKEEKGRREEKRGEERRNTCDRFCGCGVEYGEECGDGRIGGRRAAPQQSIDLRTRGQTDERLRCSTHTTTTSHRMT